MADYVFWFAGGVLAGIYLTILLNDFDSPPIERPSLKEEDRWRPLA